MDKVLAKLVDFGESWVFSCPGCKLPHAIDKKRWQFNGDIYSPTFSPSLLVKRISEDDRQGRCHSFIRMGTIQFLGDCEHNLKGHTVEIPDWHDDLFV